MGGQQLLCGHCSTGKRLRAQALLSWQAHAAAGPSGNQRQKRFLTVAGHGSENKP